MEMRLVACERMSGTKCSKKIPLSLCFVKQPVCNGDGACCRHVYVLQEAHRVLAAKLVSEEFHG
ncbi:unnamed protein product [Prunus armeniaca]